MGWKHMSPKGRCFTHVIIGEETEGVLHQDSKFELQSGNISPHYHRGWSTTESLLIYSVSILASRVADRPSSTGSFRRPEQVFRVHLIHRDRGCFQWLEPSQIKSKSTHQNGR